jgi:hypothetical protein
MLSRWLVYCSLASVLGVSSGAEAAIIGFQSDYAPANWTSSLGGGSIDISNAPTSISLTSSAALDPVGGAASDNDFFITLTSSGNLLFDWSYLTDDLPASLDPFGYFLGTGLDVTLFPIVQLTNNLGPAAQSGTVSIAVSAGQTFGFRQRSSDQAGDPATTTIFNFSGPGSAPAAVPEPASAVALCLGSLALVVRRLRLRNSVVA